MEDATDVSKYADAPLYLAKKTLQGKVLIEHTPDDQRLHKIVWVGRSRYDTQSLRVGVMLAGRRVVTWFRYTEFMRRFLRNEQYRIIDDTDDANCDDRAPRRSTLYSRPLDQSQRSTSPPNVAP